MLRRVAQISPDDREHVVDLAESYLANDRPGARSIGLYTDERPVFEANAGTQAAVDVIRDRVVYEDPVAPGMREFRFPGLVVEGVRLHDVVMRGANAAGCYARCPSGTERTSREATSTSVRSNGRSSPPCSRARTSVMSPSLVPTWWEPTSSASRALPVRISQRR